MKLAALLGDGSTFEGLALMRSIFEDNPPFISQALAVIDTGLGDGRVAAEFPSINGARIHDVTRVARTFLLLPPLVLTSAAGVLAGVQDEAFAPLGHGTPVAVAAVGDGTTVPAAYGGAQPTLGTAPLGSLAVLDSSFGTGDNRLSYVVAMLDAVRRRTDYVVVNLSLAGSSGALRNATERVSAAGKIVVCAAGNEGQHVFEWVNSEPAALAPRFRRFNDAPPERRHIVGVGGLGHVDGPGKEDASWREPDNASNYGDASGRISVVAPAQAMTLTRPDGLGDGHSGTSFATPLVSGILYDMVIVDRILAVAPRAPMAAVEIIELLEATADTFGPSTGITVGRTTDPRTGLDFSTAYGHGRVNMWKALLSAANGGVATNPGGHFSSITDQIIPEAQTTWYGFEIRLKDLARQNATLWIDPDGPGAGTADPVRLRDGPDTTGDGFSSDDDFALVPAIFNAQYPQLRTDPNDAASPFLPAGTIGAFQGVQPRQFSPLPFGNQIPAADRRFMAAFSLKRELLINPTTTFAGAGANLRFLELRNPGQTAADAPFARIPLHLPEMRFGGLPAGTVGFMTIHFDDFVFSIDIN